MVTPDGWPPAAALPACTMGIWRILPLAPLGNLRGPPALPWMMLCWMGRLMWEVGVTLTVSGCACKKKDPDSSQ